MVACSRASFTGEVQRHSPRLDDANQGVPRSPRLPRTLNEFVGIAFSGREPVLSM